jgi:hypothetical protein
MCNSVQILVLIRVRRNSGMGGFGGSFDALLVDLFASKEQRNSIYRRFCRRARNTLSFAWPEPEEASEAFDSY